MSFGRERDRTRDFTGDSCGRLPHILKLGDYLLRISAIVITQIACQAVRPDLVRRVPVRGDPDRPDD